MRLGVFGGTFDPIHRGHLAVARALSTRFRFDKLLFIPALAPPHKTRKRISALLHRFAMTALATADRSDWVLSTIEAEAPSRPYSVETVGQLNALYPEAAPVYFIIGADSFRDLPLWHEYLRLVESCHMIVSTRPGHDVGLDTLPDALRHRLVDLRGTVSGDEIPGTHDTGTRIYLTDDTFVDISSTAVRDAARRGESLAGMVPNAVAAYIQKQELYGTENEQED